MFPYTPTYIDVLCFCPSLQYDISHFFSYSLMTKQELIDARIAPAASSHIQRFSPIQCPPSRAVPSKPRRKFRAVIQTLALLLSFAQALPLPTDSNGPPLWPNEERRVDYLTETPQTGDLPIAPDVYHRIQLDTSSRQLDMTSLYDAPISTAPPPDMFPRKYHPVSRKYFLNVPDSTPLPTNKCVSPNRLFPPPSPTISNPLATQVLHEPIP